MYVGIVSYSPHVQTTPRVDSDVLDVHLDALMQIVPGLSYACGVCCVCCVCAGGIENKKQLASYSSSSPTRNATAHLGDALGLASLVTHLGH